MAQIGQHNFDWITDAQAANLLGNSRPKTLKDIEADAYWGEIFGQWVQAKAPGIPGLQQTFDAWANEGNGPARDQLKSAGPNGDLRNDFYEDLGMVKAALRQHDRESGAAEQRIFDAVLPGDG